MMQSVLYRARRRGLPPLLVASMAVILAAAGAGAQQTCDEQAGTLGIQGLRCEGCTYSMSRNGIEEARFRTEPQIMAVARGFTQGDELRAGDRIVAVDGALITTRDGSDRLVALRAGQRLTLRVRRGGRLVDLSLVAGSACELRRRMEDDEVEVEQINLPGEGWSVLAPSAPTLPAVPGAPEAAPLPPLPSLPSVPEVAQPPGILPTGYLGFGLRCSNCGTRDGVFFFTAPPEITIVSEDGPAARAGLQSGDLIVAVDGQDMTDAGARRFSGIEPGQTVALTVTRNGERETFSVTAEERAPAPGPPAPIPSTAPDSRVRFEGRLGDIRIQVRGAPVTVTRDEATGELIIRTAGNVIRLKRGG